MGAVKAQEVYYGYGKEEVLKGISFEANKGEILGILGDNGAGKSTLLSILATLQEAKKGTLYYYDQRKEDYALQRLREDIGYVPQEIALYLEETPYQNLKIFARLQGLKGKNLRDRVLSTLQDLDLVEEMDKPVKTLSGGMKRRTNLGVALIHRPSLLILDEPTVGIDFNSRKAILKVLRGLSKKGRTIIYSTHALEEVQYVCDRALVIEQGTIQQELSINEGNDGIFEGKSMEEVFKKWFVEEKEEE
ncbi:ABC transporter ATP-binding protein [Isachenkonia alkalipeptolytica]|nr:ABC transporter ATP-binding protein [Isachenkonia alkalipeptolytica]